MNFIKCTGCASPAVCNHYGHCAGSPFVKPTISDEMSTANKPATQQVDLDFHIREIKRIVGEQVVESGRFKHVRATRDDVRDIVSELGLNSKLTAYLIGMLGLQGES